MNRFLLFCAAATIAVSASAQDPKIVSFTVGNDSFTNGMSRNGKWATFQKQSGEESLPFDVQLIDLENGKTVSYTPRHLINYKGQEEQFVTGSYSQPFGVSEDGKTIFGSVNGYPAYFTVEDLTWHCLSMGSVTDNRNLAGAVYGMSGDGSIMAGWFAGTDMTKLKSALWKNGEIVELTGLPSYLDLYEKGIISQNDYYDQRKETPNYTFRSISKDGTKMVVGIDHNRPDWGCSYGVYDLTTNTFSFILADAKTYGHSFTDTAYMSDNGEWVTGNMNFIGKDENGYDDSEGVYRFHVPTGKLEIFNDIPDRDVLATAIDNNGTILAGTPAAQPMRNLIVRCGTLWVDLGKILEQKYGINVYTTTGFDNTGYPQGVSSDCKTILSQAEFRGGAFALTLPVDFATAAEGTSLLTEYAVSPASGKSFSNLNKMMVRFTYGAEPVKNAEVTVTDESGKVVSKSTKIESFSSQNLLYTISFNPVDMAEGKTYTVTIPAGTFIVPETTMGNPEIKVSYVGRANKPVAAVKVAPENNAFINVFSFNNPVTIDFDTDLTISTAVQPKLYEEGKAEAINNLSVTAEGSRIIIYPASERRLAKDHKYRIEIPANLVADLGGSGFNESFSVSYQGAFVPEPPKDPARPFFEDFNKPNEALYNFLLFDGDGRTPVEAMNSFGFDANNTPWNFSIRDDGSDNYCAASHSLYSPAGQSDDWMMIPQIDLNDKDYYLTFKAQSFSKDVTDNLKIVVWEHDEVLGSLDEELLKKVKAESKTLKEIQLIPSQTEGVLAGSWTEYELPLADYAGKKVYIAFVNENRNKSMVFVDDLAIEYRGAYTLSVASEQNLIKAEKTDVVAYINVNAAGPFDKVEATIKVPASNYEKKVEFKDLKLTTGSQYTVTFKDVPVKAGVINKFTVESVLGGLSQTYSGEIVNQAFEIPRRVLIEEGTGMWCGNCPYGEIAIEHLEETMPDNIAVISVHNGDALALTDYDQLLALGGYPNGRINRMDKVYAPLYNDPSTGAKSLTSPQGNETFKDMVLSELSTATEGEIKIVDAVYYSADNIIEVPASVRFSVSRDNTIYNIFTCVVEDGLTGRQTNYLTNQTSDLLAWWGAQPAKVDYTYKNVARFMAGGFYGISGRVPASVKSGEYYTTKIQMEVPANINDTDNMHFVVALIDATTGKVINADVCRTFTVNDIKGASDVTEIATEAEKVSMTVENGTIFVNGDANVEVYSTDGMRMRNCNLSTGIYIVRKQLADGSMFNGRILVK